MDSELSGSSDQKRLNLFASFKPFRSHVALNFISQLNRICIGRNLDLGFHSYIYLRKYLKLFRLRLFDSVLPMVRGYADKSLILVTSASRNPSTCRFLIRLFRIRDQTMKMVFLDANSAITCGKMVIDPYEITEEMRRIAKSYYKTYREFGGSVSEDENNTKRWLI